MRSHVGWGGNETFFTRVWKPLPNRRVLETLRGSLKGKAQRGQYLLAVGLDSYKWYQRQTPDDVSVRRLIPEEGWSRGGVPTSSGVDWGVPHRLEKETSTNENVGPQMGGGL